MSKIVSQFNAMPPVDRISPTPDTGYFYPGEAARILGVPDIRYSQLRAIYDLVREQRGIRRDNSRRWARFTTRDLAGAREVIRLCLSRGTATDEEAVRMLLSRVERACLRLRDQGLDDPLLQSRLDFAGQRVVARINGVTFDTGTGQVLIEETVESVGQYLSGVVDSKLAARLEGERLQVIDSGQVAHIGAGTNDQVVPSRARRRA